jgi:hypothetical protein
MILDLRFPPFWLLLSFFSWVYFFGQSHHISTQPLLAFIIDWASSISLGQTPVLYTVEDLGYHLKKKKKDKKTRRKPTWRTEIKQNLSKPISQRFIGSISDMMLRAKRDGITDWNDSTLFWISLLGLGCGWTWNAPQVGCWWRRLISKWHGPMATLGWTKMDRRIAADAMTHIRTHALVVPCVCVLCVLLLADLLNCSWPATFSPRVPQPRNRERTACLWLPDLWKTQSTGLEKKKTTKQQTNKNKKKQKHKQKKNLWREFDSHDMT